MPRDPYALVPTRPKQAAQRDESRADSSRLRDDEPTMVRCPLCLGGRMVTPEVAAMFDRMVESMKDR